MSVRDILTASYPALIEADEADRKAIAAYLETSSALLNASNNRWHALYPDSDFDCLAYALDTINRPSATGFSDCALFLQEGTRIVIGSLGGASDYGYLLLSEENAPCACTHKPLTNMPAPVLEPHLLLGINASSKQPGLAEAFVGHMLSADTQENLIGAGVGWGIPVSRTAFIECARKSTGGYSVGFVEGDASGGTAQETISYQRGSLSDQELADACALLESPQTAVLYDQVILEALRMGLSSFCAGECSLDEATENAAAAIDRYLAH